MVYEGRIHEKRSDLPGYHNTVMTRALREHLVLLLHASTTYLYCYTQVPPICTEILTELALSFVRGVSPTLSKPYMCWNAQNTPPSGLFVQLLSSIHYQHIILDALALRKMM